VSKIQQYLSNYAQDGTQQAIVLVGALAALSAYMNYSQDKPLYGSKSQHSEAQRLSAKYDDDGSNWYTEDGDSIQEDLHQLAQQVWRNDFMTLFIFRDGSMIATSDDWWDLATRKGGQLVGTSGDVIARLNASGKPIGWIN